VATATVCVSRSDAALLCRTLPMAAKRVRVVPEGVEMGAIRGASPFPTVSTLVLTVGRLLRQMHGSSLRDPRVAGFRVLRGAGAEGLLGLAFERFPHGLALTDRSHAVLASNGAFQAMVDSPGHADEAATTCCELLCRHLRSTRETTCVTERVLTAAEPLLDLEVELPGADRAMRVSGAPVDHGQTHAVIGLYPGGPETSGLASPSTSLTIRTLGRTTIEGPRGPLDGEWLDQRPGQLLRFLVAERGHPVPVERIAEAIWSDAGFGTGNAVRHLVHVLRDRLEPCRTRGAPSRFIVSRRGGYGFDTHFLTVDADVFAAASRAALAAFTAGASDAVRSLDRAISLYGGDFLAEDPYAEWAQTEREHLRAQAGALLRARCDVALERQDVGAATVHLERLAELEPFDSDIHRQLITLALRRGRRGRALRQYNAFQLRLERAFGEQPDFTLADLVDGDPIRLLELTDLVVEDPIRVLDASRRA
jgi:DNA-binding SARP family transcriptional activator